MEEKEVDFDVLKSEINQEQRRILKMMISPTDAPAFFVSPPCSSP